MNVFQLMYQIQTPKTMELKDLTTCSPALKKLVAMVGGSFKIYKGIADLCAAKYRDSEGLYVGLKETAYCGLRSQLLMALHDNGANELCSKVASCTTYL